MRAAFGIPESYPMLFAGPAAIAIRSAGGKEPAEDAVLSVEDRQMLIGDGFHTLRANSCGQSRDLRGVEIVRRCESLETQLQICFGSQRVGGVEARSEEHTSELQSL